MLEPGGGEVNQPPQAGEKPKPYVAGQPGRNFYDILGISKREVAADPKLLKSKYLALARKHHPSSTYSPNHLPDDEARFQDIAEAYEVLKDPQKTIDYELGIGRYEQTDHPDRPNVPPEPPEGFDAQDFSNANSAPTDESSGADPGQEAQPGSPEPWWRSFDSEYDKFDFEDSKVSTSSRNRTQRPHPGRESKQEVYERITSQATLQQVATHKALENELDKANLPISEALKSGKIDYDVYLQEFNTNRDRYYAAFYRANRVYGRRFHQEAKGDRKPEPDKRANAFSATNLERSVYDKLVADEHGSIEPKVYTLPDGTYLRASWTYTDGGTPEEEIKTTLEHITGEKDEKGVYLSRGIEVIRETQTGSFLLRRITRPYNLLLLDSQARLAAFSTYQDIGINGPYSTVLTEGEITNREIEEFIEMLKESTPREQLVGV